MKRPARWSVAIGTGLLLTLTALAPGSTATAADPAQASSTTHHADLVDVPARALVERALDPGDYACPEQPLQEYVTTLLLSMSPEQLAFTFAHLDALVQVPTYDPLLYGSDTDPVYSLGTHSVQLHKTFWQVKSFWTDIKSDDIQLMAMHSDVLLDSARIARALAFLAESDITAAIQAEADTVAAYMQTHPAFLDNPLWTLNAYAFSAEGDPDPRIQDIPDKLVFGDGFIEAMEFFGLGDVGPRVVMGHEFGHHIQFELGLFDPVASPEATRRTELMADTFGAYFGTHKRGLALNAKRVVDTLTTFYASGDCFFDDPGHHGTPNQRRRAATFGAELAMASQPASSRLLASEVADLFEVKLPEIVAPDA